MPIYMKFDGPEIDGDTRSEMFDKTFELFSFSWGAENSSASRTTGGGGGAGKAHETPITVAFHLNSQAPKLFIAMCDGSVFKTVTLTTFTNVKASEAMVIEKITLTNVALGSYQEAGTGDLPAVQLTLFAQDIRFQTSLPAGRADAKWNFAENRGG